MSKGMNGEIASGLARAVMKLTEMAVIGGANDAGSGAGMAMGAMAGPLFMGAGLLSKGFADQPDGGNIIHPSQFATPDAILVYCLLMARGLGKTNDGQHSGVDMNLSPEVYLAAFDDFRKLSGTPIDQVVRGDLLKGVAEREANASVLMEALMARLQAPSADKLH